MTALIACSPESEGLLTLELRRMLPDCALKWAADGLVRVESERAFEELARLISGEGARGCVFARQIAPAQAVLPADAPLADVLAAVHAACRQIPGGHRWNIHVRMAGSRGDIETAAEEAAGAAARSRSDPEKLISVAYADAWYVGVADASLCLSTWPGGERRFRKEEARISRSEFKLLEAMEAFGLALPRTGTALDLGAAPGGWTRILLEHGLQVTAVDPAGLDARLRDHPRLRHVRATAEQFIPDAAAYAVIVNDMRMSAERSAAVMVSCAGMLQEGGTAVMTLKLPERGVTSRGVLDLTDRCLNLLASAYARVRARQLFHNRSELTVVMEAGSQCA